MNIINKIRTSVEELKSRLIRGACSSQIAMDTRCKEEAYDEVLAILNSLEKSRVSVWHNTSEELPQKNRIIVMNNDQTTLSVEYDEQTLCGVNRWAYLDDLLDIDKNKEELQSDDLEKAAEEFGIRQGIELKPFASKFFMAGAHWNHEQMMKNVIEVPIEEAVPFGSCKWKLCAKLWLDEGVKGNKLKILIIKDDERQR